MSQDIKNKWKETGKELGSAFEKLGKTIVKTAFDAAKKAQEWANSDDAPPAENETDKPQE